MLFLEELSKNPKDGREDCDCLILETSSIDALQRSGTIDICDTTLYDVLSEVCNEKMGTV